MGHMIIFPNTGESTPFLLDNLVIKQYNFLAYFFQAAFRRKGRRSSIASIQISIISFLTKVNISNFYIYTSPKAWGTSRGPRRGGSPLPSCPNSVFKVSSQ